MDRTSYDAGPSSFRTPQHEASEWAASTSTSTSTTSTPSRASFPRRLSLLQNDSSPSRDSESRRTSFTAPKPLNLVSHPLSSAAPSSASSSGTDTPRRGKRTSLTYIASPSTTRPDEPQLTRAPSTSSASGRTRTGSISRATAPPSRRRPSQASVASAGANSDADDWLMSEEDASFSHPAAAKAMAARDSAKVEAQFTDTGYREGITAGKLSTLQSGFDHGFNEVGAPLGRAVGLLRGQIAALLLLTSSPPAESSGPRAESPRRAVGRGASRVRSAVGGSASASLPLLAHPHLDPVRAEVRALAAELDGVTLAQLAEPDYEALQHDYEHAVEAGAAEAHAPSRESDDNGALTGATHELLRLIAEKERRCLELRDQLAGEEAELKQLRAAWQRTATRELAYSGSPTHRRNGSASSSSTLSRPMLGRTNSSGSTSAVLPTGVPQVAAEAWSSFSAKLPGGLKSQLNNLLDSIGQLDAPPDPPEKPQPAPMAPEADATLRPNTLAVGGGLGVLEEEGSDVGSAAVSPRSPRSPAVLPSEASASSVRALAPVQAHDRLASLADERRTSRADSTVLGFAVDEHGLATRSEAAEEHPSPTPPKEDVARSNAASSWTKRSSVFGSLTGLQSRLQGAEPDAGFASMFTRRLKEARDNASDLLREAERKLGNAMTIDDLLGLSTDSSTASQAQSQPDAMARSRSPQIRLQGAAPADESPWFAAAGGLRSPQLTPEDARRGSTSSSRSSLSLQLPVRSASPHASPPIGGAPGAAGTFGMLMRTGSSTSLNRHSSASSADGWAWNNKDDQDWDGDQHDTPRVDIA